jgi:uncharacterized protein
MEVTSKILEQRFCGKPVKRMHVMVKPTGSFCNLDCSYCYYLSNRSKVHTGEASSGMREDHERCEKDPA